MPSPGSPQPHRGCQGSCCSAPAGSVRRARHQQPQHPAPGHAGVPPTPAAGAACYGGPLSLPGPPATIKPPMHAARSTSPHMATNPRGGTTFLCTSCMLRVEHIQLLLCFHSPTRCPAATLCVSHAHGTVKGGSSCVKRAGARLEAGPTWWREGWARRRRSGTPTCASRCERVAQGFACLRTRPATCHRVRSWSHKHPTPPPAWEPQVVSMEINQGISRPCPCQAWPP